MLPRNLMESAVQQALQAHRQSCLGGDSACWCSLCTSDMQALALTALPPLYVTRRGGIVPDDPAHAPAIREEVERAVGRVESNRKHGKGTASCGSVALVNFALEVGFVTIEERLQNIVGACDCWDCRCDAIAFALNRFPARYGVAIDGHSPFTEAYRHQMGDEMSSFLDLGVHIVSSLPRHDLPLEESGL